MMELINGNSTQFSVWKCSDGLYRIFKFDQASRMYERHGYEAFTNPQDAINAMETYKMLAG